MSKNNQFYSTQYSHKISQRLALSSQRNGRQRFPLLQKLSNRNLLGQEVREAHVTLSDEALSLGVNFLKSLRRRFPFSLRIIIIKRTPL